MKKVKRILALIAVVILIALYITTIVLSFFKSETAHAWFMASLYTTIALPVIIYGYTVLYKFIKNINDKK